MGDNKPSTAHYRNFGGVNEKASAYSTQNSQALNLRNLDFFTPNAWSKTPGSTQGIFAGVAGGINSIFEYERLSGESYLLVGTGSTLYLKTTGNTLSPLSGGWSTGIQDMLTFVNKAWIAAGTKFESFDGTSTLPMGLPCQNATLSNALLTQSISTFSVFGATMESFGTGTEKKAVLYAAYGYVRADGYYSPVDFPTNGVAVTPYLYGIAPTDWLGTTTGNYGGNATIRIRGLTAPSNLGITAIALYLALDVYTGNSPAIGIVNPTSGGAVTGQVSPSVDTSAFKLFSLIPVGTTQIFLNNLGGWTTITENKTSFSGMAFCYFNTFTPKYIEINQNLMFASGFSAAPSQIFFSEVGEPENYDAESFFEVRTNDGDKILGTKAFQNQLVIFKKRSFHKLIGTDESNFQLVELSTQYGCLSNQAIAEYNNKLLFLDQEGIVEYNGANWAIISTPIEPTFRRMNVSAAQEKAVAIHYQERNQVWFGIPVDGSTENNLTVVYDYLLSAWTFIEGFKPSAFAKVKQSLTKSTPWYGTPSGLIHYMSPSFFSYNGTAFTCMIETAFDAPDGADVENMFRRLFIDVNQATGVTGQISTEVYSNYDRSTVRATFSIYQNQFQTRSDFGVGGKAIGFKMYHSNISLPLTINGYDVQRRFLRKV